MRILNQETYRLVTGVLLTSMLLLLSALAPAQSEENAEVSRLLSDAREKAAVLSRDADEMEALTRSDVSWQTHAAMLDTMKEDVNDLAKSVEKLNAARDSASSWQRQAIDRMMPLMKELASNTTAAINHLKEQPARPTSGAYAEYLNRIPILLVSYRIGSRLSSSMDRLGRNSRSWSRSSRLATERANKIGKRPPLLRPPMPGLRTGRFLVHADGVRNLDPKQVCLHLHISVLVGPEVQRDRRQFVNNRHRKAVLGEVDCFDVVATGIAPFNSNVVELTRCVNRELVDGLFPTGGAQNSSVCPFG